MNCELMLTYDTPAYMFNVYKNQLSRQTGSKNLTGPKTLPTIWHTYMKLVTKYQISAINSCWEKYLGWTEGRTEVKQYTPPPPPVERGYKKATCRFTFQKLYIWLQQSSYFLGVTLQILFVKHLLKENKFVCLLDGV